MDIKLKKSLADILCSIDEIFFFLESRPKMYDTFCNDLCFRRAVERNIEIIGEAMNRVLKDCPEIAITDAKKIVATRNYIIHGYDSLSLDILWNIVVNHLDLLKTEIENLLQSEE